MVESSIYTIGGTVQAGGGIYLTRQADMELLNLCQTATFAYVLTPRQMGKSSLMVRTAERLTEEGISSVVVDLQELGAQVTAEQWYFGILVKLEDQLMLNTDVVSWWQAHTYLGVSQRITLFFEQVLLTEVEGRVVIFVDEIDSTLSLDFTDDFFIAIRYLYVARATNPDFQRLSFVLLGVATPGDLIQDAKRTPFNIGQRVDLSDFTFEEALPLVDGLGVAKDEGQQVLRWVLKWTGGHPYLTQRLCGAVVKFLGDSQQGKQGEIPFQLTQTNLTEADVKGIVGSTFFGVMSEQDNNLQFVRDMLTTRAPSPEVLTIYREIRRGRRAVVDEEQSLAKSHLKLSGVVRREHNILQVRNLIYRQVFDLKWLNQNLPLNLRDRWEQLKPALPYVIALLVFSGFMTGVAVYVNAERLTALNAQNREKEQRQEAENQRNLARQLQEQLLQTLKGHSSNVLGVAFSPDGKTIASASDDKTVKLWNLQGQELQTLKGHSSNVLGVAFSPDGKTIASASDDKTVKLWNLQGRLLQTLKGHSSNVLGVAFSPDGKTIASASSDKTVKLWNLQGQLLQTLKGHSNLVNSVAFSPDGKTIASASDDKTVKLWNLNLDSLMEKGCDWVSNYLRNNPNVSDSDRHVCDGVGRDKGNTKSVTSGNR